MSGPNTGSSPLKPSGATPTIVECRAVDLNRVADDIGRGSEAPLPGCVPQDQHRMSPGDTIFLGQEEAADPRLHPQGFEVVRGDEFCEHPLWQRPARQRDAQRARVAGEVAEYVVSGTEVRQIGVRYRQVRIGVRRICGLARGDADQLRRMLDRQRVEQQTVDHGERSGVRGDTERKRDDNRDGKSWRPGHQACAVPHVSPEVSDWAPAWRPFLSPHTVLATPPPPGVEAVAVAQFIQRRVDRRFVVQTVGPMFLVAILQMRRQFFDDIRIGLPVH
jgi:hypothetical protein